jgi:Skp family chaperone for outer membrane proteins
MKNLTIVLLVGLLALSMSVDTTTRVGYVYMEQVLGRMNEAQEMNRILERFTAERQMELEAMQQKLSTKYQEYQDKDRKGELTEAGRIIGMTELKALQAEYEASKANAEQELMTKRSDLMRPIALQLQTAMKEVAAKEGYTHVFNSADGTGNSIVVVAPESDDLTKRVMQHVGIKVD